MMAWASPSRRRDLTAHALGFSMNEPTSAQSRSLRRASDEGSRSDAAVTRAPGVSLPTGGGALRGIGEKFSANPVAGTGSMTVPILTSPARQDFGPQLVLAYDSGAGNGPFGFGWSLSLPSITRKTDKGLPRYQDESESDVFILSGAEDLVPSLVRDDQGGWVSEGVADAQFNGTTYRVKRYRPRIEGLFARIERWVNKASSSDVHWRSISRDNTLTLYGSTPDSRITDPEDPTRIFQWLIDETRDDKGNAIVYRYKPEDGTGVDLALACERNRGNRSDPRRTANRYIKRILYGNRKTLLNANGSRPLILDAQQRNAADWMFEVVFDYGDHDPDFPTPADDAKVAADESPMYPWPCRADPTSNYRPGFEVRTSRLCRRVLMFHHFDDDPDVGRDCLARSTDFVYSAKSPEPEGARAPIHSFLVEVTQTGYRGKGEARCKSGLPPVVFRYSQPEVHDETRFVAPDSLDNLPVGIDGTQYQAVDLHGEGIAGILTEHHGQWWFKANLSPLVPEGEPVAGRAQARFGPTAFIESKPAAALADGAQLMDLAGKGQPDVVVSNGRNPGVYEHDGKSGWRPFRPFTHHLHRDTRDPNLRFVDLDGDARADLLIAEDDVLVWHASLAEAGFGPARRVRKMLDEEKGPRVVFADGTDSIHLADMSGDGLTDVVRIRNGEVCYWPNLGYGRFGAKVTMDDAPRFDQPDQFEPRRIRLADIDGTGNADIIYLHRDGVRLYFNQSGNGWSEPHLLRALPGADSLSTVMPIDLLGNGTACLVWSSPLPGAAGRQMRYVDLMGGQKPHLLVEVDNNLGACTLIHYAPSTTFYLRDKAAGRPWITRLPFPVHVVEYVETFDFVSRNRFVTRYAYHHGYFDGEEREFRGFGMVEQWDTALFGATPPAMGPDPPTNADPAHRVPAIHTKTWYHTGAYLDRQHISRQFETEYYREPGLTDPPQFLAQLLPDTSLPEGLSLAEEREACRALKGQLLRQEVYADDAPPGSPAAAVQRARTPYSVVEQDFVVRRLQPRAGNRHGVFFTHPNEAITYHYERNAADPRIQHALTLEVDAFGNVRKQAAIGYGRRETVWQIEAGGEGEGEVQWVPNPALALLDPADRRKQTERLLTYTENEFTHAIDAPDAYRTPLPCESVTYELTGYTPSGPDGRYQAADFVEPDPDAPGRLRHIRAAEVPYEDTPSGARRRRAVDGSRTLYRRDLLNGRLPLGQVDPMALEGETYRLAFTPGLLARTYQRPRAGLAPEPLLPNAAALLGGTGPDQGGYVQSQVMKGAGLFPPADPDDHWWAPSGRSYFSDDPVHSPAEELAIARQNFYLPRRYRDPFGHDTTVRFDSHDLLVVETRDAVGNVTTVLANDYRVLQPRIVRDPNGNRSAVAFDALGMIAGTALMGKAPPAPAEGDSLDGFAADLSDATIDDFLLAADPQALAPGLLADATTRIVYDLHRFRRTRGQHPAEPGQWQPACAATLARETHASAPLPPQGLRIQLSFAYSDGFGREIQQKLQAEPGRVPQRDGAGRIVVGADGQPLMAPEPAARRWVGSGWTVFNNKGKPVRQYEPFFTDTHRFEFEPKIGVSLVLFYDPAERMIATLHPNHTYEKVVFDAWCQRTYDVNDTCAPRGSQTGDPRTDPDIRGYVEAHFATLDAAAAAPWVSWYQQRVGGGLGPLERAAARKAAAHADTPTTQYLDVLGRPFLTQAHNRVVCSDHPLNGTEAVFATRVELDIEGHERAVRDADTRALDAQGNPAVDPLGRVVMRYAYDLLGNRIHQSSMEAGARWMLNDVAGNPIRAWDSRGHDFVSSYDVLRRPLAETVRGTSAASDPRTLVVEPIVIRRIEYGEGVADAAGLNLRTRIHREFDAAGIVTHAAPNPVTGTLEAYDFKGNPLRSTRQLVSDYKGIPDWRPGLAAAPALQGETFAASTRYDALNRPIQSIAPHSSAGALLSVTQPVYNEAGLLDRIHVWLDRAEEPGVILDAAAEPPSDVGVDDIDYDTKGQRLRIDYRNGASTRYSYDPRTFRLTRLRTRRDPAAFPGDCPAQPAPGWPGCDVQDLKYTYDPAGNITHIQDDAQQAIYFANRRVDPSNDYTYDALYHLIEATGREHLGQGRAPIPYTHSDAGRVWAPGGAVFGPNDGRAMGRYTERYVYDAVGNFIEMQHRGEDQAPGWSRSYLYDAPSLLEDGVAGAPRKRSNRLSATMLSGASPLLEPYDHDPHGNMTRMPHLQVMRWDYRDRLLATQRQSVGPQDGDGQERHGEQTWYVYDAAGQRIRKVTERANGQLKDERIYLGVFEVYRKHGAQSIERETLHVMDDRQRIALVETQSKGNDAALQRLMRYQFGNHLGSASLELDGQAQVISYEEYYPYGATSYQGVRSLTEAAKRYRYIGKERDHENGLCFVEARYLAAWLGRWASCDPAQFSDGLNLYTYVRANPLRFTDPSGLGPEEQNLGQSLEKALKKHQDAANRLRELVGLPPVEVARQQGVGGKREVIPDEVKKLPGADEPKKVIESKARHVKSKRNTTPAKIRADVKEGLKQAMNQLRALEEAGEVGAGAKAQLLQVVHDSDKGKSSTAGLAERKALAAEAREKWIQEAPDLKTRASREQVNVVVTTRDRLSKATKALEESYTKKRGQLAATAERAAKALTKSKALKVVATVLPILASGVAKAAPIVGTAAGAADVASEVSEGNSRRATLALIGMSEIPFVSQAADIGLAVEDAGWAAKDVLDPEQRLEMWYYNTFIK